MSTFELDFLNDLERELQNLAQRDPASSRKPWLVVAILSVTAGLAVLLALTLNFDGASRPGSGLAGQPAAHAAIARARAALTPPRDRVFHVRIEFRQQGKPVRVNEIWQGPRGFRATNTGLPEGGTREDGTQELYDRARNTIYSARISRIPPSSLLAAYTSGARAMLKSGARVAGHVKVDGIDCLRIEDTSVPGTTYTLFVDARSFRPVLDRVTKGTTRTEFRFRDWQVLAPTAAAQRLTNLQLVHPLARVVLGKTAFYAAEVRLLHLLPGPPGQPPRPRPTLRP